MKSQSQCLLSASEVRPWSKYRVVVYFVIGITKPFFFSSPPSETQKLSVLDKESQIMM